MRDGNTLRLRLVVRRHALPDVRVVFAVQLDTDPTIVNLLEQVNEIIPLESNDWGLEDYAVQLRDSSGHGFDCLHFQQVSVILKNDEEVFIRPLDTTDRRKRRLSGRDQISTDGRHLIDGVAFGRPRLKAPRDRPAIDIPPLKRRRITYEAEEGDDEEPRLLLTEHGEDGRFGRRVRVCASSGGTCDDEFEGDEENEDDGDDEFIDDETDRDTDDNEGDLGVDEDIGDSELEDELLDLRADNEQSRDRRSMPSASGFLGKTVEAVSTGRATRMNLKTLDERSEFRAACPAGEPATCKAASALDQESKEAAYSRLRTRRQPVMSLDAMLPRASPSVFKASEPVDDAPDESEAESVASMIKHYDQHGFPSGSILDGTASAQIVEAMRTFGHPVKPPVHTRFDDDVGTQADKAPSDFSCEEEEGDSDSDSESDSGPEVASSKMPMTSGGARLSGTTVSPFSDEVKKENESGSESDSSSEAETSGSEDISDSDGSIDSVDSYSSNNSADENADEDSNIHDAGHSSASHGESDETDSSSSDDSSDGGEDVIPEPHSIEKIAVATMQQSELEVKNKAVEAQKPVPPGQGKTATQKRNARRRAARLAQNVAARGEHSTPTNGPGALPAAEFQDLVASIAAKKTALLQRLNQVQEALSQPGGGVTSHGKDDFADSQASISSHLHSAPDAPDGPTQEPTGANQAEASPQRTSELDLKAGRPMAFSALGPGNPKAKADHVRPTHLNRVQPSSSHHSPNLASSQSQPPEDEPTVPEDPEAWRGKIAYRAVECCQDGVKLSEPPFPFVQRWDPQQQYFAGDKNKRGGRSKRKQRNQEEVFDGSCQPRGKRRKYEEDYLGYYGVDDYGDSYTNHDDTTGFGETTLNYDDEPQKIQEQANQTPNQHVDEEDDMPPLPADVSVLSPLNTSEAVVGMILTWKQWLLSKATNWQPQISSLTGIVVDVLDDNALTVRLAKRDRNLDFNEKVYDDDGNRVYDKFELPVVDDEGEEAAEQGYRTLDLADMIEPRILQHATDAVEPTALAKQPPGSEREDVARDASRQQGGPEPPNDKASVTLDEVCVEGEGADAQQMDIGTQGGGDQSINSETSVAQGPEPFDTPIPEYRRHEISLLINDAGFRKEIDPSVTDDAGLDLSSPSRQLEEMSHDATIAMFETTEAQRHDSPELPVPSQTTPDSLDSQPIYLEPFYSFSDSVSEPQFERQVAYPKLDLPPSETASLHSGSQVDPDFSIELGNNLCHDLNNPATVSRSTLSHRSDDERDQSSEKPVLDVDTGSGSSASDSSLPSLSDLWKSTSRSGSKSSSKRTAMSAIKTRKPAGVRDIGHEAAMRRFDASNDISEDEDKQHLSKIVQKLVDKPIEKPALKNLGQKRATVKLSSAAHIKIEPTTLGPGRTIHANSSKTAPATSSPFVVRDGSPVVSLVSSSPEPELEEHYAEDSIDETYEEPKMPAEPGWVKKSRARRGVSVPASSVARDTAPKRFASSQPKKAADKRSSAALGSLLRTKKKVLSNIV